MFAWFVLQWVVIGYLLVSNIKLRASNQYLNDYIRKR